MNEPSDAELVRQAKTQPGQQAFTLLYRRYLTVVYRYFYARTHHAQQAEDLTAQTFLAALEALPRYRERGTFSSWLFTIAARRFTDHLRESSLTAETEVAEYAETKFLPERILVEKERYARLAQALKTLSPDREQAVALHFFGGLSIQETARAMKRSKIAVKSLIHRALRDLNERLGNVQE